MAGCSIDSPFGIADFHGFLSVSVAFLPDAMAGKLPELPTRVAKAWEFYGQLGRPRFICAPMVGQSELAFRMLLRSKGCQWGLPGREDVYGVYQVIIV